MITNDSVEKLRQECELATKLWGRTFGGLGAMTYREHGVDVLKSIWTTTLGRHQVGHYREGLRKLGIPESDPPAVTAAKYHYFTNIIGGLAMEYVEESPRKVWIRYTAPMWTYPGVAMMAIPGSVRRTAFSSWHPNNGAMMGCRRLGYVGTKFIMEGAPYDEGYFFEYDHDLEPKDRMRFETVLHTPEFDPSKAPRFDSVLWPEARILKARRNFSAGYVASTIQALYVTIGEAATEYVVAQTMRCLAIQYIHEFGQDTGLGGQSDVKSVALLFSRLATACGREHEVHESRNMVTIELASLKPFELDSREELKAALFEFQKTGTRVLNGRLRVSRTSNDTSEERWIFEDAGAWLW